MVASRDHYFSHTKLTWRGWSWNQLAERLPSREPVLYMPGPENRDYEKAISKGWKPWDLIAVDRDPSIVQEVRSGGGLAVCGDVYNALHELGGDRFIAGANLDLTSGIHPETMGLASKAAVAVGDASRRGAVVINLQRGRDNVPGEITARIDLQRCIERIGRSATWVGRKPTSKHRGLIVLAGIAMISRQIWLDSNEPMGKLSVYDTLGVLARSMRPHFYSYRSTRGNLYFDSVALTTWHHGQQVLRERSAMAKVIPALKAQRTKMMQKAS